MYLTVIACLLILTTLISAEEPKRTIEDPKNAIVRANRAKRWYYSWSSGTPGYSNSWSYHYRWGDGGNSGCGACGQLPADLGK